MKNHHADLLLTAIAPAIWGSTYLVTTEYLAGFSPLLLALLRALPAGLLLLLWARQWPSGIWWWRVLVLGALNFAVFWSLLFVAAYRLPGGVAATVGAVQPLIVLGLAAALLGVPLHRRAVLAALAGLAGVAWLVLTPDARLGAIGIAAALGGAVSMACGTVLTRKWQPPVPLLTFTAWQLTAGGLLLWPLVWWLAPPMPVLSLANGLALIWLGLVGAALTYVLWFRGIAPLGPNAVAPLGFLSPATAVVLGWLCLGQSLTGLQLLGMLVVFGSIGLAQRAAVPARTDGTQGEMHR